MTQSTNEGRSSASKGDVRDALEDVVRRIESHGYGDSVYLRETRLIYNPDDVEIKIEITVSAGKLRIWLSGADTPVRVNNEYDMDEVYNPSSRTSSTGRYVTPEFTFATGNPYKGRQEVQFSGATRDTWDEDK